jgi:Raf kinase inhibitor-like YbhB/YbcL family protein
MNKIFFLLFLFFISSFLLEALELYSPEFNHFQKIPAHYTCDGKNISPALFWKNAPTATQSFVLIVDDPDAIKPWTHWTVFNIPSTITSINENQGNLKEEAPFTYGATDFNGTQQWNGPCPPSGIHRYHFTLYALDTFLDLSAGATKEEILKAIDSHILESSLLIGTYQR